MTWRLAVLALACAGSTSAAQGTHREIVVDPAPGAIAQALSLASDGDRVVLRAGTYHEPMVQVTRAVTLVGEPGAVLDGEGTHALIEVLANDVTVRGLTLRATGSSHVEDRAAIRVRGARRCRIEDNTLDDTFFGIALQGVTDCVVRGNVLRGPAGIGALGGNGIHAWKSDSVTISGNSISGHRDGIYFEFVRWGTVNGNTSQSNSRYALHFMFSDDCRYEDNAFIANGSGIAVMYTRRVTMARNRFERNWGPAAYGLLLKDITDSEIIDNTFTGNTVALYMEGANRVRVAGNTFSGNGWAIKLLANSQQNTVTQNRFSGNAFDVGTNSRQNFSTFVGNEWDRYRGYDLDRDGTGDVPFAPVRLFALVVEQVPSALILLRSPVVDLLDFAERVMPMLTPATLIDERPRMPTRERRGGGR